MTSRIPKYDFSLFLNLAAAIEIPLVVELSSSFTVIDGSVVAFLLTFLWFLPQKDNGAQYAFFILVVPYSIGVFAAIYQRNLGISYELLRDVLLLGNRQLASENALETFSNFYCPISIFGFALSKRKSIIGDLVRYGLWKYNIVRKITDVLFRVLTLIDLSSELFYRITVGLSTRYIYISSWKNKVRHMKLWAPNFLRSIFLSELARSDYLTVTGISIYKIKPTQNRGFKWTEIIFLWLLMMSALLLFFTH